MNAAARKAAAAARLPAAVLVVVAVGAFLISYNLLAIVLRGGGGAATGAGRERDPVVAMPGWMRAAGSAGGGRRRPFHVALTATDAAYSRWQCRVMYYWYKRMQARPEGADMGGFTRVLHSGKPDALMGEIPTFVVDPLPAGKDHVRKRSNQILSLSLSLVSSVLSVAQCGGSGIVVQQVFRRTHVLVNFRRD